MTDQSAQTDQDRRHLRAILDMAPECIKLVTRDGILIDINPAGLAMIDATSLDAVRGTEIAGLIVPEHRARFASMLDRVFSGERCTLAFEIIGFKGRRLWMDTHGAPLWRDESSRDVEAALFVTRDITDRVVAEAERRALESQLRQSQKMQAVGRLAGGIAHDFNNLLTVIQGQISLVTATTPLDPELASSLRAVSDAAERAAALTRQLLTFSRRQVKQPRDIDLAILVRNVAALLPGVLGDDVELEMRIDEAGLLVHADPAMIQQVIFNIAVNAREAMAVGGRLQLSLDRVGQYVRLAINDTGLGISDADLPHVFEPFFTTKEVGQGSGLGLATAFGIIQEHDGHIEVESTVGRGTTIRVLLPAIPGLDGTDAPSAEAPINAIS